MLTGLVDEADVGKRAGRAFADTHGVEERITVSDSRAVLPKYCVMAYMSLGCVTGRGWHRVSRHPRHAELLRKYLSKLHCILPARKLSLGQ